MNLDGTVELVKVLHKTAQRTLKVYSHPFADPLLLLFKPTILKKEYQNKLGKNKRPLLQHAKRLITSD